MRARILPNSHIDETKLFKMHSHKQLKILYKFKLHENIICATDGFLYQLEHFNRASLRTFSQRKLSYNQKRNAYRIKGVWVKRQTLDKLKYKPD